MKAVGRYHNFSAGVLIGGRKEIDTEKERVNELNILVCTPGRLLQHMDETLNFDCSQVQVKICMPSLLLSFHLTLLFSLWIIQERIGRITVVVNCNICL